MDGGDPRTAKAADRDHFPPAPAPAGEAITSLAEPRLPLARPPRPVSHNLTGRRHVDRYHIPACETRASRHIELLQRKSRCVSYDWMYDPTVKYVKPRARAGSAQQPCSTPRLATSSRYGSVAMVGA
jgi:hypothetical protein